MLISFLFIVIIYSLLKSTVSRERRCFSLCAIILYIVVSFGDYYWLVFVDGFPFHPSDPSDYYLITRNLSFRQVLNIESTNIFYYIINWYYNKIWNEPYFISILIKLNNILVFVSAYLLITRKTSKFTCVDVILLLNPYAMVTIVRNVRDSYILLFIAMVIVGIGLIPNNHIKKRWLILGLLLMSMTRAVLLIVFAIVLFLKYNDRLSRTLKCFVLVTCLCLSLYLWKDIVYIISNQFISSMVYMGEDHEQYIPLLSGEISNSILQSFVWRMLIALAVFLFTPHPFNFVINWLNNMDITGACNIYTGFDNFLISCGSVYSYIFVIPIVVAYFFNWKKMGKLNFYFAVGFIVLYVVAFLGSTDIRNRNTAIFIMLSSVITSNFNLRITSVYYLFSLLICLIVCFFHD